MDDCTATFSIMDFEPVWLVGKPTTVAAGKSAAKFVKAFRSDGTNDLLQAMDGRVSPPGDLIIWMGEYDPQTRTFTEIPGVFAKPGCAVGEGFTVRRLPRCTMGVCTVVGKTRNLAKGAHNKAVALMKQAGYAPDYSLGFSMEYYSRETYECDNSQYAFSYYLPCKPVAKP